MFKLLYPKFWQTKGLLCYLLRPFSQVYLLLSLIRKLFLPLSFFNAKVICVGNITVGGTGKTQIVIWLAKFLQKNKISFVILTKGYGSRLTSAVLVSAHHQAIDVGDESILLSKYGQVIAALKPIEAIEIINKLQPKVIIADDGLQNPSFHKDFTIVAVDGTRFFGNNCIIPAGPLREPISGALNTCNAIVVVNSANEANSALDSYSQKTFKAKIVQENKTIDFHNQYYYAFTGIGNPERFFNTLTNYGMNIAKIKVFPDHHNYSYLEIKSMIDIAASLQLVLITTRKDYVKIPIAFINCDIKCFDTELVIENEEQLIILINEKIFQ
ncbi:MAG: tetraacyldisaccharide 4'-kinase [Rickettsiaceae bacterium]|nr:MAG: tetraacyldisaccharide 4'-kinase [Rickettsiaceae bacterium]